MFRLLVGLAAGSVSLVAVLVCSECLPSPLLIDANVVLTCFYTNSTLPLLGFWVGCFAALHLPLPL
jgi:hypothetical protein